MSLLKFIPYTIQEVKSLLGPIVLESGPPIADSSGSISANSQPTEGPPAVVMPWAGGAEATGVWIDEASEVTEAMFQELLPAVRASEAATEGPAATAGLHSRAVATAIADGINERRADSTVTAHKSDVPRKPRKFVGDEWDHLDADEYRARANREHVRLNRNRRWLKDETIAVPVNQTHRFDVARFIRTEADVILFKAWESASAERDSGVRDFKIWLQEINKRVADTYRPVDGLTQIQKVREQEVDDALKVPKT